MKIFHSEYCDAEHSQQDNCTFYIWLLYEDVWDYEEGSYNMQSGTETQRADAPGHQNQ